MEKELYNLEIDEGLEKVMPPLSDLELELLTESLLSEGCRDPLVVWNGRIVDGHNRYRICQKNRIPFEYVEKEFDDFSSARLWIIRNQLARRNVPDYVRIELVLPFEEELKAEAKKRQGWRKGDVLPNLVEGERKTTQQTLADMAGVSHGTLDKAKKIAQEADEETKDHLRNGDISIHKAYTTLKEKEGPIKPPPTKRPGDIVPGYGTAEILSDDTKGYTAPPEYVKDLPPLCACPPRMEDLDEVQASHYAEEGTKYYVNWLKVIASGMREGEDIVKVKDIVTRGYEQIMEILAK